MGGRNQRKHFANLHLTRKFHSQYTGWWIVTSILLIWITDVTLYMLYEQTLEGMSTGMYTPVEIMGVDRFEYLVFLGVGSLLLLIAITGIAVMTAHRLAGPYLAIRRVCTSIAEGDTHVRLKFRTYDKLEPIEECFNRMVDSLVGKGEEASDDAPTPAERGSSTC